MRASPALNFKVTCRVCSDFFLANTVRASSAMHFAAGWPNFSGHTVHSARQWRYITCPWVFFLQTSIFNVQPHAQKTTIATKSAPQFHYHARTWKIGVTAHWGWSGRATSSPTNVWQTRTYKDQSYQKWNRSEKCFHGIFYVTAWCFALAKQQML